MIFHCLFAPVPIFSTGHPGPTAGKIVQASANEPSEMIWMVIQLIMILEYPILAQLNRMCHIFVIRHIVYIIIIASMSESQFEKKG